MDVEPFCNDLYKEEYQETGTYITSSSSGKQNNKGKG